jgi:type I restriction enzyme S subunit
MNGWHTEPLQGVVSYIAKGIPPAYVEVEGENTVRVLNQKCNRDFTISYTESRLHDLSKRSVPKEKYLRDEDILINSTGTGTAGRIAQLNTIPCPTIVDGHMIVLRGNEKIVPRYLGYALKARQATVLQLDEGSTGQTELNRDRLLSEVEISYPVSLDEQEAIADTLSAPKIVLSSPIVAELHLLGCICS